MSGGAAPSKAGHGGAVVRKRLEDAKKKTGPSPPSLIKVNG